MMSVVRMRPSVICLNPCGTACCSVSVICWKRLYGHPLSVNPLQSSSGLHASGHERTFPNDSSRRADAQVTARCAYLGCAADRSGRQSIRMPAMQTAPPVVDMRDPIFRSDPHTLQHAVRERSRAERDVVGVWMAAPRRLQRRLRSSQVSREVNRSPGYAQRHSPTSALWRSVRDPTSAQSARRPARRSIRS